MVLIESSEKDNGASTLRSTMSQVAAVSVKNMLILINGIAFGYPTILMPRLSEEKDITEVEKAWIGSIGMICLSIGALLSGVFVTILGRRRTMQLACIPYFLANIGFSFIVDTIPGVYVALSLLGLASGFLQSPTLTYVAEITEPRLRGILAGSTSLAYHIGILLEFVLGTYLNWRTVGLVNAIVPLVTFIMLFTIPESPHWLVSKGRFDEARKSLAWLRGWTRLENIENEFEALLRSEKNRIQTKVTACDYIKKEFLHPFVLLVFIMLIVGFSGMVTIQTFAVELFGGLKVPMDSYYATMVYGFVVLVACFPCIILVHRLGKRVLLISTLTLGAISIMIIGTYAHIAGIINVDIAQPTNAKYEAWSWIPLVSIYIATFMLQCGLSVVPMIWIGELFPPNTNAAGSGIIAALSYGLIFVANLVFLDTVHLITLAGTFWFYGAVCLFGAIFTYIWIPETEGRTLQEISNHFSGISKLGRKVAKKRITENG